MWPGGVGKRHCLMSELSDEASEPELLNRSLSMWHGLGTQVSGEELDVPLDLHTAASIGQYEVVKECVQREPICGFTPLMEAAAAGHEIIVQYFLNHGVKVDARDHSGATARMLAKQYGHMKIVALMDTYSPSLPKSLYRSPEKYEDLSSSDESCPAPQRQRPCRKKGVSIHEGPRALARITGIGLGGRAPRPRYEQAPPRGYVTFNSSGENPLEEEGLCCRDVTSPINERDVESSSSSSSREEHAFCANLGPVQSSSSSEGLARAQGLSSEASVESNEDSDHACKSSARKQAKSYMKTKNPDSQWPPRAATDREGFLAESSPQTQRAPYSGPQDLAALLEQIGCLKYLQVFEEQDVDLRIFLTLTESDLKEIGITLFGPKRKMTSAIARWHSSARPPGDALELAYADRLEAEMQELAIQLHKRCEEVEATRGQVCQEQELRAVVESCLLEQDRAREDLQARLRETWALARDAALVLDQLRACQAELSSRVRQDQPPGAATLGLAVPPADSKGWQASLQAMSLPELSGALEDRVREMGQALCLVTQSLEKLQVLNGKKWRET
ncbi:ankyrin repeat and SAM domain-containing protein 3 isoform X3 [Homo sapiens]|nr:ankyrin repeat and SAM domain-containing protein 3 isoform X3 [Homo sapiens]XP_054235576.1 ankyrin repeat and SAM domain-containing protein 3 isoform X3 [Homo sapiens]|eukprot:XP_016878424.1 ankyrin repeat and SAM domain-containing protein 3 isoform X3 [Homo sapiens]